MKIKFWIFVATLALATLARGATNDLTVLLQKGLFEEEANRDLTAAIANYQSLASAFDKDRQLAATAIFRLGECYRKLGKTNEATAEYQRVIKEFGDQQTLVTLSRQNLTGLGAAGPTVTASNPIISEQVRQLNWVKKLQAMPLSEVRQVAPTVLTDATLINLIYQYNQSELDLIRLQTDHAEEHPEVQKQKVIQSALQEKIKERLDGMSRALSAETGSSVAAASGDNGQTAITDEEQQEIRRIQLMIQNSPDLINAPAGEGMRATPLITAAWKGQLVVAKYLLDHGADVNGLSGNHGYVPLTAAAENGHKAVVELLLARGADVSGRGLNPFYLAVSKGYLAVAEVLLANKADINAPNGTDANRMRPVHVAARDGKADLLQLLIQHGAEVNVADASGRTPLGLAAANDNTNAVQLLLDAHADIGAKNQNGDTALHEAAKTQDAELISLLVQAGAQVDSTNYNDTTPLMLAVTGQRTNAVRALLEHKANPNRAGMGPSSNNPNQMTRSVPIIFAIWERNNDILKLLLDHGANPEAESPYPSPLHITIGYNSPVAVQLLLNHGADPNRAENDRPALYSAALYGRDKKIVSLLLEKGANPEGGDANGYKALISTRDPEVALLLIQHKANVNARTKFGQTPLLAASQTPELLRVLLENGADPDAQTDDGNTALHLAVYFSQTNSVAILLEHHANPNLQNNLGYTPLDMAESGKEGHQLGSMLSANPGNNGQPQRENQVQIAELLAKAGGKVNLPRRDRIAVRRASQSGVAFTKGSQNWNRYSLLEMIAAEYGFLFQNEVGAWDRHGSARSTLWDNNFPFPDFKKVVIYRRTDVSAKQKAINVDMESVLDSGDCSKDVWLEWGDVVEIPEADHPVDQHWRGLAERTVATVTNCTARQVVIVINGVSTPFKLMPQLVPERVMAGDVQMLLTHVSFMLRSVLDNSKLVRVSSDLSRVKVTRIDQETKKKLEWVIDCTKPEEADLWLRDGDLIEVPEK